MKLIIFISFVTNYCSALLGIPVYVALKPRNQITLHNILMDVSNPLSSNYGNWMTIDDIRSFSHPLEEDHSVVMDWINKFHSYVDDIHSYGDAITFRSDRLTINKMLMDIPAQVQFVEHSITHIQKRNIPTILTSNADNRFVDRTALMRLYNYSESSNVSIGLIEYQNIGGYGVSALSRQQYANNQPVVPVKHIIGPNDGVDVESALDVQMASQTAGGGNNWYWNTPLWLLSFSIDFFNTEDIPDVISMSWGWSDKDQCDITACGNYTSEEYVARVNYEYLKIALRGVTITVSSGDAGAPGRTNEDCELHSPINPVFPGSSQYVTSVGATYVVNDGQTSKSDIPICNNNNCITGTEEQTVSFEYTGWTAGGGFDRYLNETPSWQLGAVDDYLKSGIILPPDNYFNRNGRAYPDIAVIGHSCPTFIGTEVSGVDGTSCSSPAMAGLLSIMNNHMWSKYHIRIGFANPLLYYVYDNCDGCFNSITTGHNWCTEQQCCSENTTIYGFTAGKRYDPVSGLGTPNIGRILHFIDNHINL